MSPLLDDRGRLLGRVNIIDLLVLVVLVALVVFAFLRFSGGGGREIQVETTFKVERVRQPTVDQLKRLKPGTEVRDETGTLMGSLKESVEETTTIEQVPTYTGDLLAKPSPVYFDVFLVVVGDAIESTSGKRIGPVPLKVGKPVVLSGSTFEVKSTIDDVLEVDGT